MCCVSWCVLLSCCRFVNWMCVVGLDLMCSCICRLSGCVLCLWLCVVLMLV